MTKIEVTNRMNAALAELKTLPAIAQTEAQARREKELEGIYESMAEFLVDYES
jgi:hypothetical protein